MNTSNGKIFSVRMFVFAGMVALLVPGLGMGKALEETGVGAGARSLAIGEGGAAALSGAESLYWNPAGILGGQGPEFILGHTAWVEDLSTEAGAAVVPFGSLGSMGVCASWQTYSGIEERDSLGNLVKTYNLTTGSGSVAWAYPFMKRYSAGISAGFLVQNGVKVNETGIPLGLGVRAEFGDIAVGLSGQDLLSSRPACNVSTSYRMIPGGYGLFLSGGAIIREMEMRIGAGAELAVVRMVKVRLGYQVPLEKTHLGGFSNLTAGFGLVYRAFGLDYAFLPLGDIGQVHRIQLTYRLGEGSATETAKQQ